MAQRFNRRHGPARLSISQLINAKHKLLNSPGLQTTIPLFLKISLSPKSIFSQGELTSGETSGISFKLTTIAYFSFNC
jgi:hypothetical protein